MPSKYEPSNNFRRRRFTASELAKIDRGFRDRVPGVDMALQLGCSARHIYLRYARLRKGECYKALSPVRTLPNRHYTTNFEINHG